MDPSWEFQAPQFVDFANLDTTAPEEDNADEFFNVDMESGENWQGEEKDIKVIKEAPITNSAVDKLEEVEKKVTKSSNLVTSWGKGVIKKMGGGISSNTLTGSSKPRVETPKRTILRAAVSATIQNVRNSPKMAFKRTPKRLGTNDPSPRLLRGKGGEVGRSLAKPSAAALPRTPEVMKKYKARLAEGAARNIDEVRERLAKPTSSSRAKAQPALKPMLTVKPVIIKMALTQPKEFQFATDHRVRAGLRSGSDSSQGSGQKIVPMQSQLIPRVETRDRVRRHSADPANKFLSQAEQIQRYQKATPDRFRSRPHSQGRNTPGGRSRSRSPGQAGLTVPKTPQLATRGRIRPSHVLSKEEREDREVEENAMKQFRAHGVGENMPRYKQVEVEKKGCTIPEPFSLHGSNKSFPKVFVEDQIPEFHAKPFNPRLMSGPMGVPARKEANVIVPKSPAFALKQRLADRQEKKKEQMALKQEVPVIRARPAPHHGVPVQLSNVSKNVTQLEPFSFAQRDQAILVRKEEKIKSFLNEEKAAREFHAQPIPKAVETGGRLPERQLQPLTKPEPFKMAIEERVEQRLAKWHEGLAKELEEQKKATQFKATGAKVLHCAPFIPKPSDKPLSEVSNFTLHSDRRAEERFHYDQERSAKEAELEGAKRQQEERRKVEVEHEVARMRKAAVHKAQPVKHYKAMEVKPSDRALTMPSSPLLQAGKKKSKTNSTFSMQ